MTPVETLGLRHALDECANACDAAARVAYSPEEIATYTECQRLELDCAAMCALAARLAARDPTRLEGMLPACMEACVATAKECRKHEGMKHCIECAEACERCRAMCSEHHPA